MDLNTQQTRQVAQHEKPIRTVRCVEINGQPMLITGSWDKTIKYWDLRTANHVAEKVCPERVYSMDARDNMLVTATAERIITVMDIRQPQADFYKKHQSPLKWQTRVVSCFTDASGYAIGSIEGRCAIQYVEDKDARYANTELSPCPAVAFSFLLSSSPRTMILTLCLRSTAPTSPSNVTATHPPTTPPTSTRSTTSHSTQSMVLFRPLAQMVLSTSGTRMPSTGSRGIPTSADPSLPPTSTATDASLPMLSATTGPRATRPTTSSNLSSLCYTLCSLMSASLGPAQRSDR